MFLLIIGVALLLTAVVTSLLSRPRVGALVAVIGLAVIAASCFTQVPTQNVGVVTSFGKTTGRVVEPGLHAKAPWHRVNDMDGTVQLMDNLGAGPDADRGVKGRTSVRLNNNSVMFVDNAFRWKIRKEAAAQLYLDWRKGGGNIVEQSVGPGLVEKELAAAINVALGSYDPLSPGRAGQTTDDLSNAVVQRINERMGDRIEVVSFTIIKIDFDDATQARIISLQEEVARTNQAKQRELTAAADARANRTLASSVSKDPNVLVARCLDNQRTMIEKGQSLLGVPSCWPGSSPGTQLVTPTR